MNRHINNTPYTGQTTQGSRTEVRYVFRNGPPHRDRPKERFLTIISTPVTSTHEEVTRVDWVWNEEQEQYDKKIVVVRPEMESSTVQVIRVQRLGNMRTIKLYGPQGKAWAAPK